MPPTPCATKDVRFPNVDHTECPSFVTAHNVSLKSYGVTATDCRAGSAIVTLSGTVPELDGALQRPYLVQRNGEAKINDCYKNR